MFYIKYLKQKKRKMERAKKGLGCKYPFGDPAQKGFYFCDAPIENPRFVYCNIHAKKCYENYEQIKDKPRRAFKGQ